MQAHRQAAAFDLCEIVSRYKKAGLIVLGKTNVPQLGLYATTEAKVYGPARNPWNLAHSTGGSSGGSAAAVAAGMVPIAHGNDGGGSIRMPASCCACFGLKPTRGRTPTGPDMGKAFQGFIAEHVLTKTVRDSAAILDVTAGPDLGAPFITLPPKRSFLEETQIDPGKLRIAFTDQPFFHATVHEDCKAAARSAAKICSGLGHDVEEVRPPFDADVMGRAYAVIVGAEAKSMFDNMVKLVGKKPQKGDLESTTALFFRLASKAFYADEYAAANYQVDMASRKMEHFFQKYDVLLSPTLALPPPKIGELMPKRYEEILAEIFRYCPSTFLLRKIAAIMIKKLYFYYAFTPFCNITGQPSASIPLYWNKEGLPIGVIFSTKLGDEGTLLRLSAQLEKEKPWKDKWPGLAKS